MRTEQIESLQQDALFQECDLALAQLLEGDPSFLQMYEFLLLGSTLSEIKEILSSEDPSEVFINLELCLKNHFNTVIGSKNRSFESAVSCSGYFQPFS